MAKQQSEFVKNLKLTAPASMEYYVNISTDKDKKRFIDRTKKIIRSSLEYRDYIAFLKEHVGLDNCVFFQNVTNGNQNKKGRISIEMHHEPFTLEDIARTVLAKYEDEGLPINDLNIADEVLKLHYENKVGLVPLSKTAHQIVHNSTKLVVPLNMCYGNYSEFLDEYEPYIDESMYEKLERKVNMTANLTEKDFEAIKKEFTYLEVNGFDDVDKMEIRTSAEIA